MRVLLLAVLAGLLLCSGCNPCEDGAGSWCSGDGITHCEYGRPVISFCCAQDGCRDVEVDGIPTAVCSPTETPDPRCDGAAPVDNICVDGVRLHCSDGYGGHEQACAGVCVAPEPGVAFCALAEVPDPRCGADHSRRCDGNAILECANGYAVEEQACLAPYETCAYELDNLGAQVPRCATAQPDPACADDPPARCHGRDILGCASGRRTIEHCRYSCYENPIDSMFPEAFCEGPACSYE